MTNPERKILPSFVTSPVAIGGAIAATLFFVIERGIVNHPILQRYLVGHWIEYALTTMFCVGATAVVQKLIRIRTQVAALANPLLSEPPAGGQPAADCEPLLAQLEEAPGHLRHGYLVSRVRNSLLHVRRKGTAAGLDAEIKYLSEMDAVGCQHSYSFLRIIIWAIPILGLLGTVIGITLAVANLSPQHLEESLKDVIAGLGMAFDHTGVSLVLSMILMFSMFATDRQEQRLLSEVDARVNAELVGRFYDESLGNDPQLLPMQRMLDAMVQATDRLVVRQTEIWQSTIEAAHGHWSQLTGSAGEQLQTALAGGLERSLKAHAAQLAASEQATAEANRRAWGDLQKSLLQQAEATAAQQAELRKQGETMLKVADATKQVAALETVLNQNLHSLAGAKNFEDTVSSLSAAIHLLTARVGSNDAPQVDLATSRRRGQAA